MPDATGLELLAQEIGKHEPDAVLDTIYFRERGTILVDPAHVRAVMDVLRDAGYRFLSSVHGVDYYPDEPRLGVLYELLDMESLDRLTVKLRVDTGAPEVDSVVDVFPTANFQEREIYDMFG
ncbi:MAG TPA: NADH-quinone oxidoreductase subunit C, partial [Solirubrobacteraceae bacterium]|nr:NADH-quinone oxidoreductase subunit C [Solirubrobacteraceae bacterium]